MSTPYEDTRDALLDAALNHVPFDGWGDATFRAAVQDADVDLALAKAVCPRGAIDLALAFHARGDRAMLDRLEREDLSDMRYRDKVATAVRFRLEECGDREVVRRGVTLFALPHLAAEGAKAVWGTCDAIWDALGDTSDDFNWYSKRATLSGVYSSTLLFWMGDDSEGQTRSWAFLDRRIDDVMKIEKLKSAVNDNALLKPFMAGPNWLMGQIKAPARMPRMTMPGSWTSPRS